MKITSINSGVELLDAAKQAIKQFRPGEVWWRGQALSDPDWSLRPSICRREDADIQEQNFVNTFRRKALARYPNCPRFEDSSSWLFLMQHYRLPTRLLDWTQSILNATYFAVNDKLSEPGALWALTPVLLNEHQFGQRVIFSPDGDPMKPLFISAFRREFPHKIQKVAAISAKEIDVRTMVQLSASTIHGTCDPLDKMDDHEKFLLKFEIPAKAKKPLFNLLYDLGIRESNLFPDLEHLAKEMASFKYEQL